MGRGLGVEIDSESAKVGHFRAELRKANLLVMPINGGEHSSESATVKSLRAEPRKANQLLQKTAAQSGRGMQEPSVLGFQSLHNRCLYGPAR